MSALDTVAGSLTELQAFKRSPVRSIQIVDKTTDNKVRIAWNSGRLAKQMVNMAAAIFRIEKSDSLKASIPPLLSLLKWTRTAGAQQDSLRRTVIAWYRRAQMPA